LRKRILHVQRIYRLTEPLSGERRKLVDGGPAIAVLKDHGRKCGQAVSFLALAVVDDCLIAYMLYQQSLVACDGKPLVRQSHCVTPSIVDRVLENI